MVVHGVHFHSLVIPYNGHDNLTNHSIMSGKAVLICRPNSHPFVDRTLNLELPVKIGRSVARARASPSNGIFDCKVLSRNHALIWYSNGKFFLKDTKSSNGTFVNNQRLSKSGEDSSPREVSSGDIVQFGVDVLENARKVTHGCIVANLKLYLPDGKEAKASPSTSVLSGSGTMCMDDLYQLNQHIQEALQRENILQSKLATLHQLVLSLKEAADLGWQALIAEDRLLSRVDILENRLQTYGKNFAEDKLREELRQLQEDKSNYQELSKEYLQKVLQEKLEAVQRFQDMERALENAEKECASYRQTVERNRLELQELANKNNQQFLKINELLTHHQEFDEEYKVNLTKLELKNESLIAELNTLRQNEKVLYQKMKQLAATDVVRCQLMVIQAQLQNKMRPDNHDHLKQQNGGGTEVICDNNDDQQLKVDKMENNIDSLVRRLTGFVQIQRNFKDLIVLTQEQMSQLQDEKMSKLYAINLLEGELDQNSEKLYKCTEEYECLEQSLKLLEEQYQEKYVKTEETDLIDSSQINSDENMLNRSEEDNTTQSLQAQIDNLKEAIKESRSRVEVMERTVNLLQEDLSVAKQNLSETTKKWLEQEEKLHNVLSIKESNDITVNDLCECLKMLENTNQQLKMGEKMELHSENINEQKEEATLLRKQLLEAHLTANQNKNEAESVKEKLRVVSEELEAIKDEGQPDNKAAEELVAARQETAVLHTQLLTLEAEIKKLSSESSENQELDKISYRAGDESLKEKELLIEKLQLKVSEMAEELVLVKEKYMSCNDANTNLKLQLSSIRQDYEAVTHQRYFVRGHCILGFVASVFIAILLSIALYPFTLPL